MKLKFFNSNKFRKIISNIRLYTDHNCKITELLYTICNNGCYLFDFSFVDIDDNPGMVTLITSKKAYELADINEMTSIYYDVIFERPVLHDIWTKKRTSISVGKFVVKLVNNLSKISFSSSEIEEFVNLYKFFYKRLYQGDYKIDVVEGDDIKYWYHCDNYQNSDSGTLGQSCMRYDDCQTYFDIYTKNPQVCKLLILKSDDNTLLGRALLWETNQGKYMDRIYTLLDTDVKLFQEYANLNGIEHTFDNKMTDLNLSVQLSENVEYKEYPYMDTFKNFNYTDKVLTTEANWPKFGWYLLEDTSGGCSSDDVVYSNVYSDYIRKKESIYINNINSYVFLSDSRLINGELYYINDSSRVRYSWEQSRYVLR